MNNSDKKHWWNKEVTWNIFIKLMVVINIIWLMNCYRIAYIGDIIDEEQVKYYSYLEKRVELQEELLNFYRKNYDN